MFMKKVITLTLVMILQIEMASAATRKVNSSLTTNTSLRPALTRAGNNVSRKRKARYKVQLQIPDVNMNGFLNDRSSTRLQDITRTLTNDIQQLFTNTAGDQRVYNMYFSDYKGRHLDSGASNRHISWQKEKESLPDSANLKPEFLLLPTLPSSRSLLTTTSKQKGTFERSTLSTDVLSSTKSSLGSLTSRPSLKQKVQNAESAFNPTKAAVTTASASTARMKRRRKKKTTQPATTTTPQPTTTSRENTFNVVHTTRLFKECFTTSESREYLILLEAYLDAYTELLSLFKLLGPVFSIAGDDARKKLETLRHLRQKDLEINQNNYTTFQSMFAYEHSPQGAETKLEGVSTILLIHKALKLISEIIKAALDENSKTSLEKRVQELYSEILAPHHEWYLRTAAYIALLSFPSRNSMMEQVGMTDRTEDRQAYLDLTSAMNAVYDDVEGLYLKYSS